MIKQLLLTLVIMLSLDSVYLYSIKDIFTKQIVAIQGSPLVVNIYGIVFCYIALVFGLYYFILRQNKSVLDAFLLGLVIYAVYETTSLALLKKWSYSIALMDTFWGGCLFALTTVGVRFLLGGGGGGAGK